MVALFVLAFLVLSYKGVIYFSSRSLTLLDPTYAKKFIPIVASVSEHQPTSWSSFYFDLQLLVFLFPAGLYYCFAKLTDANIFIILYGVTSIYFAVIITIDCFYYYFFML
jgi:dolichyl-diphosphooligosaccharide--protein glycosyltransferase